MTSYNVKTFNVKTGKDSSSKFESLEISDSVKGNVFLLHNNQKKDRIVYSFTKSRSDFTSGGAKPYKQKGTGRARMGTTRSPLKVGGSVIFGPKPRKVTRKTNKTFFVSVLKQLLLTKIDQSTIYDHFSELEKAKEFASQLNVEKTYLVILDISNSDDVHLFTRIKNIPNLYFNNVNSTIIEDVLRSDEIIYTQTAFNQIFKESEAPAS